MKFPALMQRLLDVKRQSRPLAPRELTALFRRALDKTVILKTRRSPTVDFGCVIVAGAYDSDADKEGEDCIEIALMYHPATQALELDADSWFKVCFDIAECIGHEYVHQAQYRKRKWKQGTSYASADEEQAYLGDPDEVEAYAFSIAAELAVVHKTFDIESPAIEQVVMYTVYCKTFDTDKSVMLQLRQHIIKYLRRLEVDYYEQTNPRRTINRK